MATVRITGWRFGLRKVSMAQALQLQAQLSLSDAKGVTDAVLEGRTIELPNLNPKSALDLADELNRLEANTCAVGDAA